MKTIFLSAELSTLDSAENVRRSTILAGHLAMKGYNFRPLTGVYKGTKERSFAVEVNGKELIDLLAVAKSFTQESVLIVDEKNVASLLFIETKVKSKIGKFKIASKEIAEKNDNYSFDASTGRYFVVQ
jgi:hypothetical protein